MITTSENATQKSITFPTRSVHHISFLWALCHEFVRSTTDSWPKTVPAYPSPRSPTQAPAPQDARGSSSSRSRGLGGRSFPRQAHPALLRPPLGWGPKAASRGGLRGHSRRQAGCPWRLPPSSALGPVFLKVHRASSGLLPSARGLGDATIQRHLRELQPDEAVVGIARQICLSRSITPSSIHSSRLRLRVLSEQDASAILW